MEQKPNKHWPVTKLAFLALGVGLLAYVLGQIDLGEVWTQLIAFGAIGCLLVLALSALELVLDSAAWQACLASVAQTRTWLGRLVLVRLIGEAFNVITPFGGMGGEPVKALVLRRRYGVEYADSAASLVLAKTITVVALIVFLLLGFAFLIGEQRIADAYKAAAWSGLAVLTIAIAAFFLVQRLSLTSRLAGRLSRHERLAGLVALLRHLQAFDGRLVEFYTERRTRVFKAFALALGNWIIGVGSVYCTLLFLGTPVSFREAWMIEAVAQAVRAATFFIPASIGAQEGILVLLLEQLVGSPATGLAVALVRRGRDLVWIFAGLSAAAMGPSWSLKAASDEHR